MAAPKVAETTTLLLGSEIAEGRSMVRCSWCHQSRWVHIRFHSYAGLIEWLTGCLPFRCDACLRRGWHRAHRVPPAFAGWPREGKAVAGRARERVRGVLTAFSLIIRGAAANATAVASSVLTAFGTRWTAGWSLARLPRYQVAIAGGLFAAFVLGLWVGPLLLSSSASESTRGPLAVLESAQDPSHPPPDGPGRDEPVMAATPPLAELPATIEIEAPAPRSSPDVGAPAQAQKARSGRDLRNAVTAARRPSVAPASRPARAVAVANVPRFHGTLSISSEPLGALVWVDGELIGATPVVLEKVAAGSRVVRIESDGYDRWSSAARVVANKETAIRASLQRGSGQ